MSRGLPRVVNYGPLPTNTADIRKIDVPVLGIFGALDRGIPPDKVREFEECMKAAGKRVDIKIYGGAGHAFENPTSKRSYRPVAAAEAWFHTLEFFKQAKQSSSAVASTSLTGKSRGTDASDAVQRASECR